MDRNDKGNSVIFLRQNAAEMSVPRVTVNEVAIDVRGVEIGTTPHCTKNRTQRFWAGEIRCIDFKSDDLEIAFFKVLISKATHFHRRSEEHTSELQSLRHLVCRLLLEKKKD